VGQIEGGPGGVERELYGERRDAHVDPIEESRCHRMDERHRRSPVELGEHRVEPGVAQVGAVVVR
jgi:hypothetical protein